MHKKNEQSMKQYMIFWAFYQTNVFLFEKNSKNMDFPLNVAREFPWISDAREFQNDKNTSQNEHVAREFEIGFREFPVSFQLTCILFVFYLFKNLITISEVKPPKWKFDLQNGGPPKKKSSTSKIEVSHMHPTPTAGQNTAANSMYSRIAGGQPRYLSQPAANSLYSPEFQDCWWSA